MGKKQKMVTRPFIWGEPTRKVTMTLPESLIAEAIEKGQGNISRGMVMLAWPKFRPWEAKAKKAPGK